MQEMASINTRELCGDHAAQVLENLAMPADTEAVRVDARQQPHEWIAGAERPIKTDGVDHHDDHFFPGPVDIAWDVAGMIEEWKLDRDGARALIEEYGRATRDVAITARLRFYQAAYLACRAGYVSFAAEQLAGSCDGERFARAREWYRSRLSQVLHG
jgi:hypothetical protein